MKERLAELGELDADLVVNFTCATHGCCDPFRRFTAAEGVKIYGSATRLDELMNRPCRGCGKKRWAIDFSRQTGQTGFGRNSHGGM